MKYVELYLKEDHDEVIDGIGDCVVVLTNLAELNGVQLKIVLMQLMMRYLRELKMVNGTFKKD